MVTIRTHMHMRAHTQRASLVGPLDCAKHIRTNNVHGSQRILLALVIFSRLCDCSISSLEPSLLLRLLVSLVLVSRRCSHDCTCTQYAGRPNKYQPVRYIRHTDTNTTDI